MHSIHKRMHFFQNFHFLHGEKDDFGDEEDDLFRGAIFFWVLINHLHAFPNLYCSKKLNSCLEVVHQNCFTKKSQMYKLFSMYFWIFGTDNNKIIIIVVRGVFFDPGIISDEMINRIIWKFVQTNKNVALMNNHIFGNLTFLISSHNVI